MAIFYFLNLVAAKTIEGGKLFKGGTYLRKYGNPIAIRGGYGQDLQNTKW